MISSNQIIFDLAKRTADTLANMFGEKCEVAVHNFQDLDESLIYLAGNVTNREIGSPATNLVLKELKQFPSDVQDISSYKTHTNNGVMLKSSTVFSRNIEGNVIGALCINYDINDLLYTEGILQSFLSFNNQEYKSENFSALIHDVINEMVELVSKTFSKAPASLNLKEKVEFTRQLDEKGIFLIKGSTEYIATIFGISKFTICSYLQKIHIRENYFRNQKVD